MVVVVGDSMADWLGYGLDELYSEQSETAVERKIRPTSGLVRYDTKNETLEWPKAVKDALGDEKPDAIIVMLGLNDRAPLRNKTPPPPNAKRAGEPAQASKQTTSEPAPQAPPDKTAVPADTEALAQAAAQAETQRPVPGGSYEFHTDEWATLYAKRIDEMIAALKSKGVPIVWVGLPAIRGTKATSDMSYLDELYSERAEKGGIVYVDIWDGFVDDQGRYAVQGPDFEGQIRRLRTADGVHFTKAGAVKVASYVDRELRRVMSTHVAPVALPAPESAPKSGAADARPDVGPVLPLSTGGGEHGDLLGAADHASQKTPDPVAAKVLSRGDALAAPAGRADDFSWPRPSAGASTMPDIPPQPTALSPAAPSKKVDDAKKPTDVGKDNKNKRGKESAGSKARRSTNADLVGAPVPRAPVGSR
jgi:lysophospholipase L1-like esterase